MKIIAMLPVKNESWVLQHCLRSLSFCDEVLAIDDNSDDDTFNILQKFNCSIITIDTKPRVGWKEFEIRSFLLKEARRREATHILAIDGDEMFSDAFVKDARNIISNLKVGESLALPWVNLVDKYHIHSNPTMKPFIMCDDKVSTFKETFMHVPRVPSYKKGATLDLPYSVIHFQHLNKARNTYKRVWYMMSELLNGRRHPIRINATYQYKIPKLIEYPVARLTSQDFPDPKNDRGNWQKDAVYKLSHQHGISFFEPLDIWNIPELHKDFLKENHREPKPVIAPSWLLTINNFKNKLKDFKYEKFS
ncbi:MAG: hypothetical protein QG570_261 [Patescibacteria group bacterium]|nr:hypothetical protein [Patescibacteria group bacterium]